MKRSLVISVNSSIRILTLCVALLLTVSQVFGQATVTATGAGPGPTAYPTLQAAFAQINLGTHTGAITVTIGAGGTVETGTAILNANAAPANYTSVIVKPAAGATPLITSAFNGAVIHLFGASNVTIDGSNTAGGTTRDLTIRSTFATVATALTAGIRLGSAAVGASDITIANCIIQCAGTATGMCITSGSGVTMYGSGTLPHNNVIIRNNALQNAQAGAYGYGPAAPALDLNWVVTGNDCSNVGFVGIQLNNSQGASIINNNVSNVIPPATVVGRATGIQFSFSAVNCTMSGNKINNIAQSAAGYGSEGIYINIYNTSSGVNVYNNFVSNATAPGSATIPFNGHGIFMDVGSGVSFYHNTINQNVNSTGASNTAAICINPFAGAPGPVGPIPAGAVNIRDNIFVNSQTTGNRYGIYSVSPNTIFASIDYNDYVAPTGLGFIGGTNRTTIAQVQAGFGSNVNSINVAPTFVTTTDLHLQTVVANVPLMAGTPILAPAITMDIDGATRSTTTPTIGAHEIMNKITYTPLTATCNDATVTLTPVLVESVIGIPLAGAQIPRIYYRKGAGPWFSAAGTLLSGTAFSSNWSFSIDQSIVGGVTSGDIISYFVVAQTTGGAVFANPATGMVAVDVNTVTTPPTTPNTYTVNAITVSGLVTSQNLCYSGTSAQIAPYAYTGTTGAPTQYALTWAPAGGPTNVAAYAALPASPINVTVPVAGAAGSYTATLTVRNPTTTCTKNYTIYMTINSSPGALTGGNTVCVGSSITLASATTGGTFISTTPANATVNLTSGVVTGVALGTTTIVYTIGAGCVTSTTVNVIAPPAPITGTLSACPGSTSTLSSATPGGTWSTFNPVIASVDAGTGIVSAISTDTTTVYYKVVGCPATKKIFTVNPVPAPITGYLYACVNFTTALSCATPGGTWSSGAPTIATVNATTGVVDGISNGSAPITYQLTSTGCYITNTVVIYPAAGPISGGPTICEGLSVSMTNPVAGGTWSSTAAGIVSIDISTGLATANAPTGTAMISYILGAGGCYATKVVTVSTAPTAIAGTSVFCSGFYIPFSNGTGGGVWSSSNPAVASVSATGVVHGLAGGTTTISYNTPQCNAASYAVTINQNPPPITGGITVCDGSSTTTLSNASPGGVWSLSGSSATISPSGVVTGLTLGSANVATYTMPNACFSVASIVVDTLPGVITGPDSVCQSRTVTLNTSSTGGFWSSANSAIASINALTGNVTGVLYGATTISYAAVSGCTRTKPFIVSHPLLAYVTVTRTPGDDTLCAGTPITFTAHHVNGGSNPAYQWQIFGVNTGTNDTNFTYTPTHGDVVSCFMTNSLDICSLPSPAYVNIPINIYPNVSPIVTITTTSSNTITHLGQVVTFYAEVTTAGGAPSYQWIVDGETIPGATSNVYVREVYDNDTVYCIVNGRPPCPTGSLATSNAIIIFGDWLGLGTIGTAETSLSLFPNPNAGTFTLAGSLGSTANETVRVDVVNVLGQVVFTGSTVTNSGAINYKVVLPAGISAGTYMLRANGETGNKVFHFTIGE